MSKITITLEDRNDGRVKVVVNPSLEKIVKSHVKRKTFFTPAEAYTLKAMQAVHEASKKLDKLDESPIIKPTMLFND